MTEHAWQQDFARALAVYLAGEALDEVDAHGRPVRDDNFLLLFNAAAEDVEFRLPATLVPAHGLCLVDTADPDRALPDVPFDRRVAHRVAGRSLRLVRFARPDAP